MTRKPVNILIFIALCLAYGEVAFAEGTEAIINAGDTAWIMLSTALVMLMTPALGIFYAGMARKKNVLGTIMHSFILLCLVSIQWVLLGYTLSFGADVGGIIGNLDFIGLKGVGLSPLEGSTIPHQLFMLFQGMFAVITVALMSGAFAERIKFSSFLILSIVWTTIVYDPLCHWVWGGGWLGSDGALDFAGGTVVHISSGISALVAAVVIGKRKGYLKEHMAPHNLTLTLIGTALLWFGWFGFNAGSALAADGTAVGAFVVTNTSAAAAGCLWVLIEWLHRGKPTLLGAMSGAVAGLVGITPAAGYVSPLSSILIGAGASIISYYAVTVLKPRLGYDDSLDVFGIHGLSGTWGALATGIFANESIGGTNGLLYGNPKQLWVQLVSVVATALFAGIATYIILKIIDVTIGLRVNNQDEIEGLDISQHGENGYVL